MEQAVRVRIYGDSVMKGTILDFGYRYHAVMEEYLKRFKQEYNVEAENRARFGITVDRGASLLKKDIEAGLDCDFALIEFGGNDCNFKWNEVSVYPDRDHRPLTELNVFRQTYSSMIADVQKLGVRPVLMTLPPIDAERYLAFLDRSGNNAENILKWLGDVHSIYRYHEMYSNAVAQIARQTGTLLVDVRAYFLDKMPFRDYVCIDGLHPTNKGYDLIAQAFSDFARTLGGGSGFVGAEAV
ncbi:MAG: SGNH/GDSL hydrolase family protein [Clostridiaceae bacterium]|nr:SGNH/GDSL hydrolase family protein [Eubacteriales bacterium]